MYGNSKDPLWSQVMHSNLPVRAVEPVAFVVHRISSGKSRGFETSSLLENNSLQFLDF